MKKLITFFAALLCFAATTFAQDYTDVTLIEQFPTGSQIPRSPSVIPITCHVFFNAVYVSFSEDIGEVEITLEEAFEGIILQTSVDSSELSVMLPFSGAPGEYIITFQRTSGAVYYGTFVI